MRKSENKQEDLAAFYFHQGTSSRAFDYLGAHREGDHVFFRVWAPNAELVSVCGEFNGWNPNEFPMARVTDAGVWEGRISAELITEGTLYKYCIRRDGREIYKADPYGFAMGCPPETASAYRDIEGYSWRDSGWMRYRRNRFTRERAMEHPEHASVLTRKSRHSYQPRLQTAPRSANLL